MPTLADARTRDAVLTRIDRLTPEHGPAWGRLTAPRMVAHLADALRMAFGEVSCRPRRMRAARHFPLKHLFLYVLPIPKGVPTAPELLAREPAPWAEERGQLAALVARFGETPARAAWPEHPLFGPLTAHEWGTLTYKHVDHHLRQFGV